MNDNQIIEELLTLARKHLGTSHFNFPDWINTPLEPEYQGYVDKWRAVVGWLEKEKRMRQGLRDTEGK